MARCDSPGSRKVSVYFENNYVNIGFASSHGMAAVGLAPFKLQRSEVQKKDAAPGRLDRVRGRICRVNSLNSELFERKVGNKCIDLQGYK